jgi:hypothetical protein
MTLPLLALPLGGRQTLRQRWDAAAGSHDFKRWGSLRGADKKRLLHDVALSLAELGIEARSVYKQILVSTLMEMQQYSIEHILPRSRVNGSSPGAAENDPRGWRIADRSANSRRGNLPLVLWPDPPGGPYPLGEVHRVGGVLHYFPPNDQRPAIARMWLFLRFHYRTVDVLSPPSDAQIQHASEICAFAKTLITDRETAMNRSLRQRFGVGNPLVEDSSWLDDPEFRAACFT